MKVNFANIKIKDIEGNEVTLDIRKALGNVIYMQGINVEECDLGRTIYYSEGDIELTEAQVTTVKRFADTYPWVTRDAIHKSLN